MSNQFHSRLIDIKTELTRIPHATVEAFGKALADNGTVGDVLALVRMSAQDARTLSDRLDAVRGSVDSLSGDVERAQQTIEPMAEQIQALMDEHAELARKLTCLIGLVEVRDCIEHWSKDNWKSHAESLAATLRCIEKPMLQLIADNDDCLRAWKELGEGIQKGTAEAMNEQRSELQSCCRKLLRALVQY